MSDAPPPREIVTELHISEELGDILSNALPGWNPVAMAYVDEKGKPQLSFRGSVQRYSSTQLAVWARNPEGGLVKALGVNPALTFLFADWHGGDAEKRVYLNFVGRGHIETGEDVRRKIYDAQPQIEKRQDPDRKGLAVVVDISAITGLVPGKFLKMTAAQ